VLQVNLEPTLNLEQLLTPIPGENPSGENLRYAGLYDEIREARREDDDLEQGEWQKERKTANYHQIYQLATDALSSKSKDLEICAFLTEAMVKLHGFAGMRDGLTLTRGLLEKFWENLHPEIEDGDLDGRANALSKIDRCVSLAVKEVPITDSPIGVNYSFSQFEDSKRYDIPENADKLSGEEADKIAATRERAEKDNKLTSDKWRVAKNASKRDYYEKLFALLNTCWDEFKNLDKVMDDKFGNKTPGMGDLKKSLDLVRTAVEKIVKEKRLLEPDVVEGEKPAEGEGGGTAEEGGAVAAAGGPIRGRQDALRKLAEIANYFRQVEPHSPVSYLVQRAVYWGKLPLETWLEDVIKDPGVLGNLRETLGIKKEEVPK
jgi:type VI secretion system protein ImpA